VADPDRPAYATSSAGQQRGTMTLLLPVQLPDVEMPVIEIFPRS
jgi:alpha-L-fucosidase